MIKFLHVIFFFSNYVFDLSKAHQFSDNFLLKYIFISNKVHQFNENFLSKDILFQTKLINTMTRIIFFQIFHRVNSITWMEFFFQLAIFQVKSIISMTIFFSIAFNRFGFQFDHFIFYLTNPKLILSFLFMCIPN